MLIINLDKKLKVRDIWPQKDLGAFDKRFEQMVPPTVLC